MSANAGLTLPAPVKDADETTHCKRRPGLAKKQQLQLASVASETQEDGVDDMVPGADDVPPVVAAAGSGDLGSVRRLLDKGASATVADAFGMTALHAAADNGHVDVVELLLRNYHADPVDASPGHSPLYLAAAKGHSEVVEVMLLAGAGTNRADREDAALHALTVASKNGHIDAVDVLLRHFEEHNPEALTLANAAVAQEYVDVGMMLDTLPMVPLVAAAINGHAAVAQRIVQHHTHPALVASAALLAAARGHLAVVLTFLDRHWTPEVVAEVQSRMPRLLGTGHMGGAANDDQVRLIHAALSSAALSIAAENGHETVVNGLLERGVSVRWTNADGFTPLHVASIAGHAEIVRALLRHGAEVAAVQHSTGATALHIAATKGHTDVAAVLLEHDAPVNAVDLRGDAPLISAAIAGHSGVARALLEHSATVTAERGGTPVLHVAALNGHGAVVSALLEFGAPVDAVDSKGCTALFVAGMTGRAGIVRMLLEHGADASTSRPSTGATVLHIAAAMGHAHVVSEMLAFGAPVNAVDGGEYTPLLLAALARRSGIARALLERGADVAATQASTGSTALHLAAKNGCVELVTVLLEFAAPVNTPDASGNTPLNIANTAGHAGVTQALLAHGAEAGSVPPVTESFFTDLGGVADLLDFDFGS